MSPSSAMRDRVHELQEDWLDYTIVGGQVNVASRLEEASLPDQILISHDTFGLVKDRILCQPVGEIKVKGIAYPVRTYRVVGWRETAAALKPIHEDRAGFRLVLDPKTLTAEDVDGVRQALKKALRSLDRQAPSLPSVGRETQATPEEPDASRQIARQPAGDPGRGLRRGGASARRP